jgi:hypothetical protein
MTTPRREAVAFEGSVVFLKELDCACNSLQGISQCCQAMMAPTMDTTRVVGLVVVVFTNDDDETQQQVQVQW